MTSLKASIIRSSGLLFQSSPNCVQPMPMMATLSFIPSATLPPSRLILIVLLFFLCSCLIYQASSPMNRATTSWLCSRRHRFPEVAVNAPHVIDVLSPEGHFHGQINFQRFGFAIGKVECEPPAAVELHYAVHLRRAGAERQAVAGIAEELALLIGEAVVFHLVDSTATGVHTNPLIRILGRAAVLGFRSVKTQD